MSDKCAFPGCWGRRVAKCSQCSNLMGCSDHSEMLCDGCVVTIAQRWGACVFRGGVNDVPINWLALKLPEKPSLALHTFVEHNGFSERAWSHGLLLRERTMP